MVYWHRSLRKARARARARLRASAVCFLGKNQESGVSRATGQYVSSSVEIWCVYFVLNGAAFRDDTPWRFCLVQLQNSMQLSSSDGISGVMVFNCALVGEFTLTFLLVLSVFRTHVLPFW